MVDVLLVHGANVTAEEWERVVPALLAHPRVGRVVAPDMPGRRGNRPGEFARIRLDDYLATVIAALDEHALDDVVLVGHSAGGISLAAVAAARPERIRRRVYLAAVVPENGRSVLELLPGPQRLLFRALARLFRARERGVRPFAPFARWALGHDLQPEDRARITHLLVPEPLALLTGRLHWPQEQVRAPASYVLTTRDRVLRPGQQRQMAGRLPAPEVIPVPMGHASPVLYPERLVSILLQQMA